MNTVVRRSLSAGLFLSTFVTALFLVPDAAPAQTFFGSGGTSNAAQSEANLAFGFEALYSETALGQFNTAIGYQALYSDTAGEFNTAIGYQALFSNTGSDTPTDGNTANGNAPLIATPPSYNTAIGYQALFSNTRGIDNTANGGRALYNNTTGSFNTANGSDVLSDNTTGNNNTANGNGALYHNTTGSENTANGVANLTSNTTGSYSTANGVLALYYNTTGWFNTANGAEALEYNTTGSENTANGFDALFSNTTGNYNIALGYGAGQNLTTGSNNIDIGNNGIAAESGVIRIGTQGTQTATCIAGIDKGSSLKGVEVFVNANGQLGTVKSSRRFKKDIRDMGAVSDKLMRLRPVTFRYKQAAEDGTCPVQYGLIAEEVAKVYPDLVQYDKAGKPFTIYYHLLTPMLLNELQKAHRQVDTMSANHKAEIASLKAALRTQSAALQAQRAELAALKQSQQQQLAALAKLSALVQTSQNRGPLQSAAYAQH